MRRLSLVVFLTLCVLCAAHLVWYYPQLPDRVASHFGFSGQPDAWSTKKVFITNYLLVTGFSVLLFLGITYGMQKIPVSLINLPNKDFWLSEERKKKTYDFLFQSFLWFASATVLLMLDITHQSFQVNLGKTEFLSHPMLSMGLYIGFTVVWIIGLFLKFRKTVES